MLKIKEWLAAGKEPQFLLLLSRVTRYPQSESEEVQTAIRIRDDKSFEMFCLVYFREHGLGRIVMFHEDCIHVSVKISATGDLKVFQINQLSKVTLEK